MKKGEVRQQKPPKLGDVNVLPFELKAGWQVVTIEQVLVELRTGPFGSSLHQSDYQVGGVPVVNPASIQNEYIVPIEKMAVGVATLNRLSTFKLKAGDIVMGRRGEMGRCAVVTDREAGWLCGTGSLKWTPIFGPAAKVVFEPAPNRRGRSRYHEEDPYEAQPGVQGEGGVGGTARPGVGGRDCAPLQGPRQRSLQVETAAARQRGAVVRDGPWRWRGVGAGGCPTQEDRRADGGAGFLSNGLGRSR